MSLVEAARSAAARARAIARPRLVFWFSGIGTEAVGKWKTCFWFSTFPSALVVEAVGMWESRQPLARFPRGSWKEGEACHIFGDTPRERLRDGFTFSIIAELKAAHDDAIVFDPIVMG